MNKTTSNENISDSYGVPRYSPPTFWLFEDILRGAPSDPRIKSSEEPTAGDREPQSVKDQDAVAESNHSERVYSEEEITNVLDDVNYPNIKTGGIEGEVIFFTKIN
jgi:hypothetical protein